MSLYELRVEKRFWWAVRNGFLPYGIVRSEREYKCGDTLWLYERDGDTLTGRKLVAMVIYVLRHFDFPDGIPEGYCALTLKGVREV